MSLPELDRDTVVSLRNLISIASHVKGRLRLKISMEVLSHPLLKEISNCKEAEVIEAVKMVRGIVDVRLNMLARSLVLQYDPAVIAPLDLKEFVETKENTVARKLLDKYVA